MEGEEGLEESEVVDGMPLEGSHVGSLGRRKGVHPHLFVLAFQPAFYLGLGLAEFCSIVILSSGAVNEPGPIERHKDISPARVNCPDNVVA